MYHGTDAVAISKFDPSMGTRGSRNEREFMVFSTPDEATAEEYGKNVLPLFVRIERPLTRAEIEEVVGPAIVGPTTTDWHLYEGKLLPSWEWADELARKADEVGADGFVVWDNASGITVASYVALSPEQIKGAIGNNGDYDPNNPNILRQDKRGSFSPDTNLIVLLKGADLTTFLHETGHFFLEMTADLASRPDAPVEMQQDMQTLLAWFGVRDMAEWTALDFEEKRAYHEKFAEGFERYLFDGKSPSIEMHGLFQRFRAWMLNVYKSLKNMRVELTDEVRGVIDRMLATTEQIQTTQMARSMLPLFQTAEQAGMTPEAFKAYHDQALQATQEAISTLEVRGLRDMQWLAGARSRELKRLQAEQKEVRAETMIEARRQVMEQPIYRAWQFLTAKGEEGEPAGRLKREDLAGMYGGQAAEGFDRYALLDWKRLTDQRMTADDGLHPDIAAEQLGFSSGDELVRALLSAEKPQVAIEALTDQLMLTEHADLATPEALEDAANAAVSSAAHARFVTTEYNALAAAANPTGQAGTDKNGRPIVRPLVPEAAKQFAAETIARQRVRNLKPGQYTAAESKAARAAEKAFKTGDIETAAAEKRNAVLSAYLAKAAYDARDNVEQGIRYLKKFDKASARKAIGADYGEQIDALLERFDLRQQSLKAIDRKASLAQWVESQQSQGIEPDLPPGLLDEAQRKSYKDMTVEEFRGLVEAVQQIEHLGRLKRKLLTARDQRDYETARDAIAAGIIAHAGDRQANTRTPVTALGRAALGIARFGAAHLKASTIARVLDGGKDGGPMWEYFLRTANERADMETVMRQQATERLTGDTAAGSRAR
ncbi:MAG: hypothetical protein IPM06_20815 [Rhizobiales bacterium]|nr:hypothetical protein [Hyphomicrobiales bacterium]